MKDRDDRPGLKFPPLDTRNARQLVRHFVQSTAVHSRSKGWLPMLKLDLTHIPLVGRGLSQTLELMMRPDDVTELIRVLNEALARAYIDAATGVVDGLPRPPHKE